MSELVNGSKIQTGTVDGLLEFLDFVVAKGYGPSSTVGPHKSAIRRVFQAVEDSDEFGEKDVKSLDLDEYLDRFDTKARGNLKAESIQTYRSRAGKAVQAYREYLDTGRPPAYRQRPRRPQPIRTVGGNVKPMVTPIELPPGAAPATPSAERLIDYPFPLQSGQIAMLRLPVRLEKADAERMAAFVRTLVFEPQLALAAPREDDE